MTTYVTLIVDESGSMGSIRESAISMCNAQLKALRVANERTGGETRVTLISFNEKHKVLFEDISVEEIPLLQDHDYLPKGGTAMYDAIAYGVERQLTSHKLQEDDAVLFLIITDGEENSSERHKGNNGLHYIRGLLDAVQFTNQWTVTFMGTEDALEERESLNIGLGNSYMWTASNVPSVLNASVSSINSYYNSRAVGETSTTSFFVDPKTTDEVLHDAYGQPAP
jgi:Mg-chelatase subunit ChlD